ncbi:MAG: phosphoribosylanthranilate isomerase [Geobacteraceae bacterium]
MVKVKICGISNMEDALLAAQAGADALGFVFHNQSPRSVFPEQVAEIVRAMPPFVQTVGLFVNADMDFVNKMADLCRLDIVQLHGDEAPEYCAKVRRRVIKAFRVKDVTSLDHMMLYRVAGYLLDAWSPKAYGGTGITFNWEMAQAAGKYGPVILAGGLTPDNVRQAVKSVNPYGVDVSSGVEAELGKKDPEKMREFIRRAKQSS